MRNLILLSRKGGVTKTTAAVHVAAILAGRGARVLLADGDANQSAMFWSKRGDGLGIDVVDVNAEGEALGRSYREGKPYDVVVVDTPAAPTDRQLDALLGRQETVVLLPTTPDALAISALLQTFAELDARKGRGEPVPPTFVLMSKVKAQAAAAVDAAAAAIEQRGGRVLKARVRDAVAFQHGALAGLTAKDYNAAAYADYERVVDELIGLAGEVAS